MLGVESHILAGYNRKEWGLFTLGNIYTLVMDTLKVSILKHSYTPAQSPNKQTGFLAHGLHISSES